MKYKNTSKGILKFRAHDKNGKKRVFALKSGEKIESDRAVDNPYLELIKEGKSKEGDE